MDQPETERSDSAGDSEPRLPAELQARVLQFLPPNECALSGRLVGKGAWKRLNQPHHCTASFRLPLPPHAVDDPAWQPHLQQAFKQAPMRAKLQYLSAAASSGSVLNLEVAWRLLQPCLFPELLPHPVGDTQGPRNQHHHHHPVLDIYTHCLRPNDLDPGAAAVAFGHAHAFAWLVQHGCPLEPQRTLVAAAEHCDLAGLKQAWGLLCPRLDPGRRMEVPLLAAAAAVRSPTHQTACAKLAWLLLLTAEAAQPQGPAAEPWPCRSLVLTAAAVAAAASGNVQLLQWLCDEQGLDLARKSPRTLLPSKGRWSESVLAAVLEGGDMDLVRWLVGERGYPLPSSQADEGWEDESSDDASEAWEGAARGGSVEAMRWLLGSGVPVQEGAIGAAAGAGRLKAVQFLHAECGLRLTEGVFVEAAGSRGLPTAQWLLQAGCPMSPEAYDSAAKAGDAAMVEWLATEAKCPLGQDTMRDAVRFWG